MKPAMDLVAHQLTLAVNHTAGLHPIWRHPGLGALGKVWGRCWRPLVGVVCTNSGRNCSGHRMILMRSVRSWWHLSQEVGKEDTGPGDLFHLSGKASGQPN